MKIFVAHNVTDEATKSRRRQALGQLLERLRASGATVCDPEETTIPRNEYAARFKYCLEQIATADALVVDASERLGLGVGAEMMFARERDISVFVVCPLGSYYRRPIPDEGSDSEWLHPFIHGLATKVFGSVDECAAEIQDLRTSRQ